MNVDRLDRIRREGVYYLFQEGPEGPLYATLELDDGFYLYAFSDERLARALSERWQARVGYFPDPRALEPGLPQGTRGILLDYDPEVGEAWRVRWEEL